MEVNHYSGIGCSYCVEASYQDSDMPHSGVRPRIEVNDTPVHRYDNVVSYKYEICAPKLHIETKEFPHTDQTNYYFIFDCPGEDAIGHWVYESFMFHSLYSELKKQYPTLQVLSSNKKKYVKLLFRFFDLDDNIIYELDTTKKNICFFPPITSFNELLHPDIFLKYLDIYSNSIQSRLINFPKKNKCLFLPRNTVDNYVSNDRTIPYTNIIRDNVIEIGGTVLNTYELNNIDFQYNIVHNSDIIILDFGGSLLFNTIFLENKTILLLCDKGIPFYYESMRFHASYIILEFIKNRNNLILIDLLDPNFSFEHIQKHIT